MSEDDCGDEAVDASEAHPPPDRCIYHPEAGSPSVDEIHDLFANERRRRVLSVLEAHPDDALPVDELVDRVVERERPDPGPTSHRDRVLIDVHHVHLPKLADASVIEFDPVAEQVRYCGPDALSSMLDLTAAIEEAGRDDQ